MSDYIKQTLENSFDVVHKMHESLELQKNLAKAVDLLVTCLSSGHKVLFAGNGGSAADAQHMSAEFVARFMFDRPGLPSIALTTDTSALTAIGNDYGFEHLFSRQIQALGKKGDTLVAYSTSGTSPNILKALKEAKAQGVHSIGFTGMKKGCEPMMDLCDVTLQIPSPSTPHIQEGHLIAGHILCGAVEQTMFKKP